MRNTIIVILVALLSAACGGEAFTTFGPDAGGEAGAPDVTGAAGSVTAGTAAGGAAASGGFEAGGSASAGAAGKSAGGSASGGSGVATGGSSGAPSTCVLDPAKLASALPHSLTWATFDAVTGNVCASCSYEPCGQMSLAWGNPAISDNNTVTYQVSYTPTSKVPMTVRVGSNDGICASKRLCEVKPLPAPISVSVARRGNAWVVKSAAVTVDFADDDCTSAVGKPGELVTQMNLDLQAEIMPLLINLEIPCN